MNQVHHCALCGQNWVWVHVCPEELSAAAKAITQMLTPHCTKCHKIDCQCIPQPACLDCGLPYAEFPLDVVLPRSQWLLIHPADDGLLCAGCIVKRAKNVPGVSVAHLVLEAVALESPADTLTPWERDTALAMAITLAKLLDRESKVSIHAGTCYAPDRSVSDWLRDCVRRDLEGQ